VDGGCNPFGHAKLLAADLEVRQGAFQRTPVPEYV
jgi:hypothetical protein